MKKIVILILLLNKFCIAQTSYDSSFHFYYYDQKLSMFEQNTTTKTDIIWLGDSITDGGEWAEFFPKKRVLNRGVSSDNTFGVLHRVREVTKRKPKKIFLLIGINDIARNIPDSIILRNFQRIVDCVKIQSPKTKLYIQSILPTNDKFTIFKNHQNKTEHILVINMALQKMCNEQNLVYVDLYNNFINIEGKLDEKYTNDGLHLLGEGYVKWREILREILNVKKSM
jgi:lysophospholipase L1-like esterase